MNQTNVQANQDLGAEPGDPGILLGQIASVLDIEIPSGADVIAALQAILDGAKKAKGGASEGDDEGGGSEEGPVASKALLEAISLKDDATESQILVAINSLKQGSAGVAELRKELDEVKGKVAERDVEDLLRPMIKANKINPLDAEDFKVCKRLAGEDPVLFKHMMEKREPYAAPGRTTAPPGAGGANTREVVIANKAREFDDDAEIGRLTSKAGWVGEGLREQGLQVLTDKEREALN